jgi:Outer membrane protein W
MSQLKTLVVSLLLAGFAALPVARAADTVTTSPWSVRVRATYLDAVDQTVKVQDKLIPELDIGYTINDRWSLELVLTIPQEHDVKLGGNPIGDFKHLPPTLFVQYHPAISTLGENFKPYIGAGLNFTLIFDEDLLGGAAKLENYSVGPAAQIGFDWVLNDRWAINVDLKKIFIGSDVEVGGAKVIDVNVDPLCYSLGLTCRF